MGIDGDARNLAFQDYQERSILNIAFTNSFLDQASHRILKTYQMTRQQYNVLRILKDHHPAALNIQGIRQQMLDPQSDVSRIITRLIKKELIVRTASDKDARESLISILPNGLDLVNKLDKALVDVRKYLDVLSEKEADTLNLLLEKIRQQSLL